MKTRCRQYSVVSVLAVLAGLMGACGGESPSDVDGGLDGQADVADADAYVEPDARITSMTVQVVSLNSSVDATALVPGATVALDKPSGERVELVADAEGRVQFEDIHWTGGAAAVTAHHEGLVLCSQVNLSPADDFVQLFLFQSQDNRDLVEISGTASGMQSSLNNLSVSAGVDTHRDSGDSYDVLVERDLPFILVAMDSEPYTVATTSRGSSQTIHGWIMLEHPGVPDATTMDLDFDNPPTPVTPFEASGSVSLPTSTPSPLWQTGMLSILVSSMDSGAADRFGEFTYSDINAAGDGFNYDVQWVEPSHVTWPRTIVSLMTPDGQYSSGILALGYPQDGPLGLTFLTPPVLIPPAGSDPPYPVHEPVTYQIVDTDVYTRLFLMSTSGQFKWVVYSWGPHGSMTVPPVPSSVSSEVALLGTGPLVARLQVIEWHQEELIVRRAAVGESFQLEIP